MMRSMFRSTLPVVLSLLIGGLVPRAGAVEIEAGSKMQGALAKFMDFVKEMPSVQKDPALLEAVKSKGMLGSLMAALTGKKQKQYANEVMGDDDPNKDDDTEDVMFLVNLLMVVVGKSQKEGVSAPGSLGVLIQNLKGEDSQKQEQKNVTHEPQRMGKTTSNLPWEDFDQTAKDLRQALQEQKEKMKEQTPQQGTPKRPMGVTVKRPNKQKRASLEAENARLKEMLKELTHKSAPF